MTNQPSTNGTSLILTDQTEILNHCLQAIKAGEASLESCVQQFPGFPELVDLFRCPTHTPVNHCQVGRTLTACASARFARQCS